MLYNLSYKYYHKRDAKTVYLVLHGGGPVGIETPFIANIINALIGQGNSVLGFNFPYCERGEENASGSELTEEVATLDSVVQFLRSEGYEEIVIVAKSLGGIIASYWLAEHPNETAEVVILGYVIGSVRTKALQGKLRLAIQGENDRFGNADAVKEELAKYTVEADVAEVYKADHSYRNEQKEPIFQDKAIEELLRHYK